MWLAVAVLAVDPAEQVPTWAAPAPGCMGVRAFAGARPNAPRRGRGAAPRTSPCSARPPPRLALGELFGRGKFTGSVSVSCIRKGDEVIGALTVGAVDVERYRQEESTVFLDYIAEAIGQLPACQ